MCRRSCSEWAADRERAACMGKAFRSQREGGGIVKLSGCDTSFRGIASDVCFFHFCCVIFHMLLSILTDDISSPE